jgi:hypothetical protein
MGEPIGQDATPAPAVVPPSKSLPFRTYAYGLVGAYFFSLFLPCLLLYWRAQGKFLGSGSPWDPGNFALLMLTAVILILPGTTVLGLVLIVLLRRRPQPEAETDRRPLIRQGASVGAALALCNLPAYLGVLHIDGDVLRMVGLILVGGATAGAWIGHQVFRGYHPQYPFLPRWSLQTLFVVVLALALLMWLYMPKEI